MPSSARAARDHVYGDHRADDLRHGAQRHAPAVLGRIALRDSAAGDVVQSLVSYLFLFFFRGWGKLAAVISVATIITYLVVPISVLVLRRTAPDLHRPLRNRASRARTGGLRAGHTHALLGPLAPTGQIMLLLILPAPVYLYYQQDRWWGFRRKLRGAWWLFAYLSAIVALCWAGSKEFDGHGYIGYGWDQLCVRWPRWRSVTGACARAGARRH